MIRNYTLEDGLGNVLESKTIETVDIDYRIARENSYPKIGDQLDAIWKEIGGNLKNKEAQDIYSAILAVKAQFPKPEKADIISQGS